MYLFVSCTLSMCSPVPCTPQYNTFGNGSETCDSVQQPMTINASTWSILMQVVVVFGANPAGACIVAQHIYTSLPKAMPQSGLEQLQQYAQASGMHDMQCLFPDAHLPCSDNHNHIIARQCKLAVRCICMCAHLVCVALHHASCTPA